MLLILFHDLFFSLIYCFKPFNLKLLLIVELMHWHIDWANFSIKKLNFLTFSVHFSCYDNNRVLFWRRLSPWSLQLRTRWDNSQEFPKDSLWTLKKLLCYSIECRTIDWYFLKASEEIWTNYFALGKIKIKMMD